MARHPVATPPSFRDRAAVAGASLFGAIVGGVAAAAIDAAGWWFLVLWGLAGWTDGQNPPGFKGLTDDAAMAIVGFCLACVGRLRHIARRLWEPRAGARVERFLVG